MINEMTMQVIGIRIAFWVQKDRWPELGTWLVAHSNDAIIKNQVRDLTKRLEKALPRVFWDGTSVSGMYLGQVVLKQKELQPDLVVTPRVTAILWSLQDFLLEFSLNVDFLKSCSDKQRDMLVQGFGPYLQRLLRESLDSPPEYVAAVQLHVDKELVGVKEDSDIPPYLDRRFKDGANYADVYWAREEPPTLFLWTPQTLSQPAHILVSSDAVALDPHMEEIEHLLVHEVLSRAMRREIENARTKATQALALRDSLSRVSTSGPTVLSLFLGSSVGGISDLDAQVSRSIIELNEAAQKLQDIRGSLKEIRTVYDEDLLWHGHGLTLLRYKVARGRLIKISKEDVGHLTLGSYVRRNGLQILSFYDQRIEETRDRLHGLLASYQTLLEVRTTRQSDLLNRLVLNLTVATIFLAVLQVLSAFEWWQESGRLYLLAAGLLAVVLLARWAVAKWLKRR